MNQFSPSRNDLTQTMGAVTGSTTGMSVATGTTALVKGSWVSIGTAGFSFEFLRVFLRASANNNEHLVDIGIDAGGGSANVIAEDLLCRSTTGQVTFDLALHVPAGSALVARASRSSSGSGNCLLTLRGHSQGPQGAPGFSRLVRLTPLNGNNPGVLVVADATFNHYKTRTQLLASSGKDVAALYVVHTNMNSAALLYDLECGGSGSEELIAGNLWETGTGYLVRPEAITVHRNFPAGTRFSVNLQSATLSAAYNIALYGYQG